MARKNEPIKSEEKFLDINADMQGKLTFKDPVNLKINGNFDGDLITKGLLVIGSKSVVTATIEGDEIEIGGRVTGKIMASQRIHLTNSAKIDGHLSTPRISIEEGAFFHGQCNMQNKPKNMSDKKYMNESEVCTYLEIEPKTLHEWAAKGKIPAVNRQGRWEFERSQIDQWVAGNEVRK